MDLAVLKATLPSMVWRAFSSGDPSPVTFSRTRVFDFARENENPVDRTFKGLNPLIWKTFESVFFV